MEETATVKSTLAFSLSLHILYVYLLVLELIVLFVQYTMTLTDCSSPTKTAEVTIF